MSATLFGQFLELGLSTADIAASVQFYERLGFAQLRCNDIWSHPYGVISDGRLCIGLHQRAPTPPSLSFVRPELSSHVHEFRARGMEPHYSRLGESDFHELQLHDPSGQLITLLEARTFSPPRRNERESLCGYFTAWSIPTLDAEAMQAFWERAGLVALPEAELPFPHLPLTSDHLSLALHRPNVFDSPALLFTHPDMRAQLAQLTARELMLNARELPRGLSPECNSVLFAPEGTAILLLNAEA